MRAFLPTLVIRLHKSLESLCDDDLRDKAAEFMRLGERVSSQSR